MNREYQCSFSFVTNDSDLSFETLINKIESGFQTEEQFPVSDAGYISDTEAYLYIDKDDGTRVQIKFDPVNPNSTSHFVYVDIVDKSDSKIDGDLVENVSSRLTELLKEHIDDVQLMD